jgi:hypothetical protein
MVKIIEILAKTPLPTILVLVGCVMLSIGFGLKLKVIFDVEKLNQTYAKIAGIAFLFGGIFLNLPIFDDKSILKFSGLTDPFLIYYLIGVPVVVILFWVVLKFTPSEMQVRAIKYSFFFVGFLATIVVIWRAIDIYAYISNPELHKEPLGVYKRSTFLPYVVLIAIGILISIWTISVYTREQSKLVNRLPIYSYFLKFCMYLITCRLAWEVVDWIARLKIPENQ